MSLMMGVVTASLGPGDSIFRLKDVIVWLGIAFATILALAAYGAIFNTLGLLSSRYGVYIALVIGVYEFVMAVLTLGGAELIPVLSVSHWTFRSSISFCQSIRYNSSKLRDLSRLKSPSLP